jgi:hypothetical protein
MKLSQDQSLFVINSNDVRIIRYVRIQDRWKDRCLSVARIDFGR